MRKGETMLTSGDEYRNVQKNRRMEGDIYKTITVQGIEFEIRYGYYDDGDRANPYVDPIEIYPDFLKSPVYTAEGIPFATALQMPCKHFSGEPDEDNTCYQCLHYKRCEELIGLCQCKARRRS